MRRIDLRKLNTRIAYPWPVEAVIIGDVTDLGLDEMIYASQRIGSFVLGRDKLGDEL